MADHFTTVIVLSAQGKPVKAEVICGGRSKGYTDERHGTLTFPMQTKEKFSVSAKKSGIVVNGEVKGGEKITLKFSS